MAPLMLALEWQGRVAVSGGSTLPEEREPEASTELADPLGWSEAQTLNVLSPSQTAGYAPPTPFQPRSPTVGSPPGSLGMYFRPMSSSVDPALFFSPSAMGQLNFR